MSERHARCTARPSRGRRSSLWYFSKDVGYLRVALNFFVIRLAGICPSFRAKNWLYRRLGAKVHPSAAIALEATLDVLFPQLVTVEADAIIGYGSTVLCHEYMRHEYRIGPVVVRRNATVGANCTFLPGVVVGEGATVSAMSLVNRDVPPGEVWGGVPIRRIRGAWEKGTEPAKPG